MFQKNIKRYKNVFFLVNDVSFGRRDIVIAPCQVVNGLQKRYIGLNKRIEN